MEKRIVLPTADKGIIPYNEVEKMGEDAVVLVYHEGKPIGSAFYTNGDWILSTVNFIESYYEFREMMEDNTKMEFRLLNG